MAKTALESSLVYILTRTISQLKNHKVIFELDSQPATVRGSKPMPTLTLPVNDHWERPAKGAEHLDVIIGSLGDQLVPDIVLTSVLQAASSDSYLDDVGARVDVDTMVIDEYEVGISFLLQIGFRPLQSPIAPSVDGEVTLHNRPVDTGYYAVF
ncbi:MAG: hypothetical protein ACR2QH_02580 [Geminicoccaceae bacterium]